MPILGKEAEFEGVLSAARLMAISARTAPKSGGEDDILIAILTGEDKQKIAEEMYKIAEERGIEGFRRDGKNVSDSDAVVLVGVRGAKSFRNTNCGACGHRSCKEFDEAEKRRGLDFIGPNCFFKLVDLGIALGSAAKTASTLNVDNRVMYRIGAAASRLKLMPEATVIVGIPISARGKSMYFDRK